MRKHFSDSEESSDPENDPIPPAFLSADHPVIERVDGFKHEYHYNEANRIIREVVIRLNDDGTETSEKSIADYDVAGNCSWESYSDGAGKSGSWFSEAVKTIGESGDNAKESVALPSP